MMQGNEYQQKCGKHIRISYHTIPEFRWLYGHMRFITIFDSDSFSIVSIVTDSENIVIFNIFHS
jgi:hypothetical protein